MKKISLFYFKGEDQNLEDIIERILKNKKDIDGKVEFKIVDEFPEKFSRNDVIILKNEDDKPKEILNKIYLYKGKLNSKIVKDAQDNSVYAVFDVERFYGERMEYDEIARFESVLKKLLRNKLSTQYLESDLYKDIDWKIEISEEDKFISMFSDETMRESIFKANRIIESIKPLAEQFKNFRERIKESLKTLMVAENSENIPQNVLSAFESIERKASEINYTKLPSIMITGSTGSGKTLFAKYIAKKFLEDDMEKKFARVPIVNMGNEIVDSELFGSFPGAYTGSLYKTGKILANAGGVIFLDEIGEISSKVQAKLLTYFDDMRIIIDGYSDPHGLKVPVLIIGATNKDLKREIESGNFRQDLFERFDYSIRIPPLKERKSDIRYILSFAIQNQAKSLKKEKDIHKISLKAIEKFEKYDYPGNFRELESMVREAIMNAYVDGRDCILERDVPI